MKYYELDTEEQQILDDIDGGKYVPVDNQEEALKIAQETAKNTLAKIKNINIRLTYKDLQKLKAKAIEKGMPYQTLVSSILHQYAGGRLKVEL